MNTKEALQKVSEAACRFIYTNYELDEIANGKDVVMYCLGDKMIVSIYIRENCFDFLLIFCKEEREQFEKQRSEFPQAILDIYDNHKTWNDGKWIWIPVADMEMLEAVEKLIMIKQKPNRKPFAKETAIHSKCGMRCDLCVHYTGGTISDEFRKELKRRVGSVFGYEDYGDTMMLCPGCFNKDSDGCGTLEHARSKGLQHCLECEDYPCSDCGLLNMSLQANRSTPSDTITWAILPYIGGLNQ